MQEKMQKAGVNLNKYNYNYGSPQMNQEDDFKESTLQKLAFS